MDVLLALLGMSVGTVDGTIVGVPGPGVGCEWMCFQRHSTTCSRINEYITAYFKNNKHERRSIDQWMDVTKVCQQG